MKSTQLKILLLSIAFCCSAVSFAQAIKGNVSDAEGPLPGASVVEKGTSNGTQTDFDGNFTLTVSDANAILEISYIGYLAQEIPLNGQDEITVVLEQNTSNLDEVIVVGYGTQSRAKVTGAIASVSGDELNALASTNTESLLQGRAAGVNVENSGGAPGTGAVVTIRGSGTLSLNDQPLYVVDGNIVGSIAYLSSADIKDIQVLKDAAAASIYGNRAANGVVLVTTKRGVQGPVQINLTSKIGVQSATNTLDYLNGEEYVAARNQGIANSGVGTPLVWNGVSTDWQDFWLDNALFEDYNINVSGGGENATFYVSGQYLKQDGIVNSSGYERYNLRANSSFRKGRFKVEQSFLLSREKQEINSFFYREFGAPPTSEVFDENNEGGFAGSDIGRSVNYYGVSELVDDTRTNDRALINLAPSYEIVDGLTYKFNLGISYGLFNSFQFTPTFFISGAPEGSNNVARLTESYRREVDVLAEHTLNYSKSFGNHDLSALIGYTTQKIENRTVGGTATDFGSNDLRTLDAGQTDANVFGPLGKSALKSYIGRLTYDFKDKYLLTASLRRDETSRFTKDNRVGYFPGFSLGWRLSEESFLTDSNTISELKLRGSWGQLGNQNVGNFVTQSSVNINNGYAIGNTPQTGVTILNLANPNIFWETTTSSNVGVDLELLDGKWNFVADYFVKETEDILVGLPIPIGGGQGGNVTTNAASIRNSGFEFLANYKKAFDSGLFLSASLNFTTLDNEVTALGEGVSPISAGRFNQGGLNVTRTDVGQPAGSYYGHVVEGVYQTDAEIAADGRTGDAELGDLNFRDLDNDGDIDDDDRDFLGSIHPDYTIGLNLSASYKNFDLSMFWTSVQGVELFNARYNDAFFRPSEGGEILSIARNAWTPSNTNTNIPRLTENSSANNNRPSSFYVEDGSYTRLKNIELGYTVPDDFLPENTFAKLRLYLSAQNILTFTDYSGYDPEVGRSFVSSTGVGANNGAIFDAGIDRSYPTAKSVFFGLQASF